jgi:hypothetical protein
MTSLDANQLGAVPHSSIHSQSPEVLAVTEADLSLPDKVLVMKH